MRCHLRLFAAIFVTVAQAGKSKDPGQLSSSSSSSSSKTSSKLSHVFKDPVMNCLCPENNTVTSESPDALPRRADVDDQAPSSSSSSEVLTLVKGGNYSCLCPEATTPDYLAIIDNRELPDIIMWSIISSTVGIFAVIFCLAGYYIKFLAYDRHQDMHMQYNISSLIGQTATGPAGVISLKQTR